MGAIVIVKIILWTWAAMSLLTIATLILAVVLP
jgi:hypothetical protein